MYLNGNLCVPLPLLLAAPVCKLITGPCLPVKALWWCQKNLRHSQLDCSQWPAGGGTGAEIASVFPRRQMVLSHGSRCRGQSCYPRHQGTQPEVRWPDHQLFPELDSGEAQSSPVRRLPEQTGESPHIVNQTQAGRSGPTFSLGLAQTELLMLAVYRHTELVVPPLNPLLRGIYPSGGLRNLILINLWSGALYFEFLFPSFFKQAWKW